jgi:GT2 family glycosyltransferase
LFRSPRPDWLSDKRLSQLSMVDLGPERRALRPGEWVVGANIAYRTAALRAIGGFSTSLGRIGSAGLLSAEETDVAARLTALGYQIAYDPAAMVEHLVDASRTTQAWFARRTAWQAVSALLSGETGTPAEVASAAAEISKYFAALHPADRHVGALLADQPDAGDFDWQLGTIYNLLVVLLTVGHTGTRG